MVCPVGRVKTSDQPLTTAAPVLVTVRFSVRPVFHAFTVAATRHAPVGGGGLEGGLDGGLEGGVEVGGGAPPVRTKNEIAYAAMPVAGRLCPAPWMLYASTWTVPELSAYPRRFQPGCGVSVDV